MPPSHCIHTVSCLMRMLLLSNGLWPEAKRWPGPLYYYYQLVGLRLLAVKQIIFTRRLSVHSWNSTKIGLVCLSTFDVICNQLISIAKCLDLTITKSWISQITHFWLNNRRSSSMDRWRWRAVPSPRTCGQRQQKNGGRDLWLLTHIRRRWTGWKKSADGQKGIRPEKKLSIELSKTNVSAFHFNKNVSLVESR